MWKDLNMKQKAELMATAVKDGVSDLNEIRHLYNVYANGGYTTWKKRIKQVKGIDIDNDKTYDYEGYYKTYPEYAWEMLNKPADTHFTDEFKTSKHPTFSEESLYSGNYNYKYNPTGKVGGNWGVTEDGRDAFRMSPAQYIESSSLQRERINYLIDSEDNGVMLLNPNNTLPTLDGGLWGGVLQNVDIYPNTRANGGNLFKKGGQLNPQTFEDVYSMIREHEGFYANAYVDGKSKNGTTWYSIGYGTNDSSMHKNLARKYKEAGKSISREEAERLMREEVAHVDGTLRNTMGNAYDNLTPGQKMALLDVGYQRPASMIAAAKCLIKGDLEGAERNLFVRQAGNQRNLNRRAAFNGDIGTQINNNTNGVRVAAKPTGSPTGIYASTGSATEPVAMDWFNNVGTNDYSFTPTPEDTRIQDAMSTINNINNSRRIPLFETINPVQEAAEQRAIASTPITVTDIDPYGIYSTNHLAEPASEEGIYLLPNTVNI